MCLYYVVCVVRVACGCVMYVCVCCLCSVCVVRVACGYFVCVSGSAACHVFVRMLYVSTMCGEGSPVGVSSICSMLYVS